MSELAGSEISLTSNSVGCKRRPVHFSRFKGFFGPLLEPGEKPLKRFLIALPHRTPN
jgi:hypothetical protein